MTTSKEAFLSLYARASITVAELEAIEDQFSVELLRKRSESEAIDRIRSDFYEQFDEAIRTQAASMSGHYELFYAFENSIRDLVSQVLQSSLGANWWDEAVPDEVKQNVQKSIDRERDAAVTARSTEPVDYTTFGELSVIIERNFDSAFGDIFNSRKGVVSILSRLNVLRGPIAHCSPLAEDEVMRLNLSLRDWFRLME